MRRNLEKQNKILSQEINSIIGGQPIADPDVRASENYLKERPFNPLGWGSDPNSLETRKFAEYRKQGLLMIEDVATRPRNLTDPSRLEFKLDPAQGGLATTGDGEIVMNAETELIPVAYKLIDRKAASKFELLDQEEMVAEVKKEVKKDRIVDKLRYHSPEDRLEDLKRKNVDFDTLLNEMVKDCRHIYEDEIGIRPIKRGKGVETLDQIIDNLYNDDFKVKNLPPKSKAVSTDPSIGQPLTLYSKNGEVKPSPLPPQKEEPKGLVTDKFNIKVQDSPTNAFTSFNGNESVHSDRKHGVNPFMLESHLTESPDKEGHAAKQEPRFAYDSTQGDLNNSPGIKGSTQTNGSQHQSPEFGTKNLGGQFSFGQQPAASVQQTTAGDTAKTGVGSLNAAVGGKPAGGQSAGISLPETKEADEEAGDEGVEEENGEEPGEEEGLEEIEETGEEEYEAEEEDEDGEEPEESVEEAQPVKGDISKNGPSGGKDGAGKAAEPKGVLSPSNSNTGNTDDLKRSESKKKVTFSAEIDKKKT